MAEQDREQNIVPKKIRVAWAIAFFVFTPISLLAEARSTGAGHGDFVFAFALYPLPVMMILGWKMLIPGIIVCCPVPHMGGRRLGRQNEEGILCNYWNSYCSTCGDGNLCIHYRIESQQPHRPLQMKPSLAGSFEDHARR